MSVTTVQIVARRFLISETPEILVLKGAWGVGKTFEWNQLVNRHKNEIKLANYCYVSLFGISSIQELRTTIFTKTQPVSLLGEKLDANTINNEWNNILLKPVKNFLHTGSKIIKGLPYGENITIALETLTPHLIRNTIICLDDFERINTDCIKPDELLGFISELKEEKNCKVTLIFNEDKLGTTKDTYEKYREKVIDIELLYKPTAEEAAKHGLPSYLPYREIVKKYAVSLGITNIRILQKIVKLIEIIHQEVKTLHTEVMEQAIMTLVLLVWCYYDSDKKKPTLEFIIKWNRIVWGMKELKGEDSDSNFEVWTKVLQDYGLMHMDEFDQTIYKVIERGYLEETDFSEEAIKLDARIRANELGQSFSEAWKLFHNSFADNQAEFIQTLTDNFKNSVLHISPLNLNGTTTLLRQLGRGEIADELIDYYIDTRANENELFNLAENTFSGDINDPAVLERFKKKYAESHPTLLLIDAVNYISAHNGWSIEHIDALKLATENDFYNLFKLDHGDLRRVVNSCLQFEEYANDDNKAIGLKARAALVRIGKKSQLNAIRVRRYGVTIEPRGNELITGP